MSDNVRLALVGVDGIVETVIEAPAGSGPEFPSEVLGIAGNWVLDPFVQAGPGSLFISETGDFYALDLDPPTEEPAP
ncbi:hypothetical protein [Tabrizicola soli]|uniref:Uncharacterized protein n=1 Tax=Tabrizicola soli TaxID=2185115 RepID=A0ABV7E028_9RHOB|nr:hypothetical protein [Tabrizicola soli]